MPVPSALQSIPSGSFALQNLDFTELQQQLIEITEEIRRLHELSVVEKLKDMLFQEPEDDPRYQEHVEASALAEILDTREARSLSDSLAGDPAKLPKRVELVRMVLRSKKPLKLNDYRNLLLQACLPIYVGYVTPYHLQLSAQVFRLYLKKVIQFDKKKMLTVRSRQLGGLNVSRISLQDILKSVEDDEDSEEASTVQEIKYAQYLLDHSKDLLKMMRARISIPVDLAELNHLPPPTPNPRMFIGDISTGRVIPDKQAMLSRKVMAILEVMKDIYPLHAISLRSAGRMQEIEDKMPQAFVMEGRVRMESLKLMILRMLSGDSTARMGLKPTFNKILETYRKALRRASVRNPQPQDIPVLAEFVQLTLYAQMHRVLLEIDLGRMRQLLGASKKACDSLVRVDGHYQLLQERLNLALKKYGLYSRAEHTL